MSKLTIKVASSYTLEITNTADMSSSRALSVRRRTSPEKQALMAVDWRQLRNNLSVDDRQPAVSGTFGSSQTATSGISQAYCTCGLCIEGYISPRMKWLLSRYATIFGALLPRSLNIFEGLDLQYLIDSPNNSFEDLDVYTDLDHLPLPLKRLLQRNKGLMHGYCDMFVDIADSLKDDFAPSCEEIDKRILESHTEHNMNARLFLLAGGNSKYAMKYLIETLKELSNTSSGPTLLELGLGFLPLCSNDHKFSLLEDRLLLN